MRPVSLSLPTMNTPEAPLPAQEETQLAQAEHRLFVRLMVYRAVVLGVALLFIWDSSLTQTLITFAALVGALLVGQLIYRSQLGWTRRQIRLEQLRQAKAAEVAREAAAREAERARQASYFDWDDEDKGAANLPGRP